LLTGKRRVAGQVCEKALAVSEQYADGLASERALAEALSDGDIYSVQSGVNVLAVEVARRTTYVELAGDQRPMRRGRGVIGHPASEVAEFARAVVSSIASERKATTGQTAAARKRAATLKEKAWQVRLVRDLFGNPFRPVTLDPALLSWHRGTVVRLAEAIYQDSRWADMPILADALEEAGCEDENILGHCRGPGPHTKGCWVADLLLNKQ
jgi:hypothetical protein